MKRRVKYILVLFVVFALLGPLLLMVENHILGPSVLGQALPITVIAVVYFVYGLVAISLIGRKSKSGQHPLGTFLLDNVVRFFMTCVMLVVYGFVNKENIVPFVINLLAYYLATLVTMSCFTVHVNRGNTEPVDQKMGVNTKE